MNVITIELCAEDRARLDRLAEALERKTCGQCVASALAVLGQSSPAPNPAPVPDRVQQQLAEALANAEDPAKAHPADEELPRSEPAPAPSLEEFQKALTLRCAESDETKAKVRALLHEYAPAASKVPEDKRAEVLDRLAKL